MFERICLDRWSYNSTACLQKLGDNDSCTALKPRGWLTICRCVWGRELKNEVRFSHLDAFCLQLPRFSCETNTATIILRSNINTQRAIYFFKLLILNFYLSRTSTIYLFPRPSGQVVGFEEILDTTY